MDSALTAKNSTDFTVPGGGRCLLNRDLTENEKQQYVDYCTSKSIHIDAQHILIADGVPSLSTSNLYDLEVTDVPRV